MTTSTDFHQTYSASHICSGTMPGWYTTSVIRFCSFTREHVSKSTAAHRYVRGLSKLHPPVYTTEVWYCCDIHVIGNLVEITVFT